jgi:uncharacterized phage infection (PIP) family protein YhgE
LKLEHGEEDYLNFHDANTFYFNPFAINLIIIKIYITPSAYGFGVIKEVW